jgi:hypothetical protein
MRLRAHDLPMRGDPGAGAKGGFLAIDALVGLSIMALGLVFVIEVSAQSLRLLSQANDLRVASAQAAMCLEATGGASLRTGQMPLGTPDRGAFTIQSREVSAPGSPEGRLCLVECTVRSHRSNAVVRLHTKRLCQATS